MFVNFFKKIDKEGSFLFDIDIKNIENIINGIENGSVNFKLILIKENNRVKIEGVNVDFGNSLLEIF